MADSSPPWSALRSVFEPSLPAYCEPESDFLFRFSSTFHTCVPTKLAFISSLLGTLSIVSWLFAQLPQIYKNYTLKSTSGLSIFFLAEWLLGDLSNLLGSLFTDQALWQVIIACYYCFVDCCLVAQWIWYERLRHGRPLVRVWRRGSRDNYHGDSAADMTEFIDGVSISDNDSTDAKRVPHSDPKDVFRSPQYSSSPSSKEREDMDEDDMEPTPSNRSIRRIGRSGSPYPSPRTVLYVSMLLAVVAQASPLNGPSPAYPIIAHQKESTETATQVAGRLLSWLSTVMYLGSRMPQLYKNYKRKSTSGLSPTLFLAAFMGNLFYSSSILSNPCAWGTYPPHGARGWVGSGGSVQSEWVGRAIPFWLGAAGVLMMDGAVGVQFWYYGEGSLADSTILVPEEGGKRWRWRRVSGWLRGWIPSVDGGAGNSGLSSPSAEEQRLLGAGAEERYGGV
ncbi:putative pq loop repeat protein [Lasiodiplodia theobromae]|uniref:Pq loop repeat protein n=1 Tax=Lasiodiplodia theobromae TaxID=45133 RepID=A0A5N5DQ64_9PEZI|nr:Pq loop repeat protein [Lasiodiplodia theobromae]KAB2578884.1 putative vacuolar amino acid transporter YPQ2 [Lasiodiplodia theobromae]KAF4546357.1 Pq loop repeat protein [Lasiodiplodia theobromae]KAF9630497.1 putative pq loop repeat protein [Lasiodiplodia theobromae]